jgi:ribosomal protein L10
MSKFVKDLIAADLKNRLADVSDLLVVNVVGLDAIRSSALRRELRSKNINLLVVKNSLARRATEGTQLAGAFEGSQGSLAVLWGASDIVTLAKEVTRLARDKDYAAFQTRGGVMGGARLTAAEVDQVSKWPTREEQLSILMGQVLSPAATLSGQLIAMGGSLASQIKQIAEKDGGQAAPEGPASPENQASEPAAPSA